MSLCALRTVLFPILVAMTSVGMVRHSFGDEKQVQRQQEFADTIQPLLAKYCYQCHGTTKAEGDLSLAGFQKVEQLLPERKRWLIVSQKLETDAMPPDDAQPQPTKEERKKLVTWITATLRDIDCSGSPDPGRVTLRRLNRRKRPRSHVIKQRIRPPLIMQSKLRPRREM